jgi:hypothetical protein
MEISKVDQDEVIRDYLERVVSLQRAMDRPREELYDTKREAKAAGVNIEALNALQPILSKHEYDKGAGVLKEVVRYAEIFGADIIDGTAETASAPEPRQTSDAPAPQVENGTVVAQTPRTRSLLAAAPVQLSTQFLAAVFLTIGLIWLLN